MRDSTRDSLLKNSKYQKILKKVCSSISSTLKCEKLFFAFLSLCHKVEEPIETRSIKIFKKKKNSRKLKVYEFVNEKKTFRGNSNLYIAFYNEKTRFIIFFRRRRRNNVLRFFFRIFFFFCDIFCILTG